MSLPVFLCIAAIIIKLVLACIVLVKDSGKTCNKLFSLILFLFVFWSLAELNLMFSEISEKSILLLFIPGVLLAYFFCVFTAVFPEEQKNALVIKSNTHKILFFLPALFLIFLLFNGHIIDDFAYTGSGFTIEFGNYEFIAKGIIIGYLILSLKTLANSSNNAKTEMQIKRLRYTFTAMLLPIAGGSIFISLSKWFFVEGSTAYSFGVFPLLGILMSLILSYTMLKYNLMEIDIIFSIGLVYTLLSAILAGSIEIMQEVMQELLQMPGNWSKFITVLFVAAFFSPLKDLLISIVDRFFGRHSFDSAKVMRSILSNLRQAGDCQKLLDNTLSQLCHVLNFTHGAIVLNNEFKATHSNAPIIDLTKIDFTKISSSMHELEAIEYKLSTEKEDDAVQAIQQLRTNGYRHAFIFAKEDKVCGSLLLGAKLSKVPYTESELNLIAGITGEIPHLIENLEMISRLLTQQKNEQELQWAKKMLQSIASSEQVNSFENLNISSFSSLTQSIKGDMIDICNDKGNSFLAVYDAFNSGIQAVLTLEILFSVFRSVKETKEKFINTNRILQLFSSQNMCSAATFLTVDDSRLNLYNFGNPSPIIVSKNKYLKVFGQQSKPLGLSAEIEINSTQIQLKKNQLLLLTTNGLLKAFKELAGISIEEFLTNSDFKSPQECREKIIDTIAPDGIINFSDDITFVITGIKN